MVDGLGSGNKSSGFGDEAGSVPAWHEGRGSDHPRFNSSGQVQTSEDILRPVQYVPRLSETACLWEPTVGLCLGS